MRYLALALSLGSLVWGELALAGVPASRPVTPPVLASAPNQALTVTVYATEYRTFGELMQAARASAQTLISRTFAANAALPAVTVQIVGERTGTLVPLGVISVARADWLSQPNLDLWSQWFGGPAQALLGFGLSINQTAQAPNPSADEAPVPRGRSGRARRDLLGTSPGQ